MAVMAFVALLITSCDKHDYSQFIGTWGVEKIEYYNIDYAGNPIASSMRTFEYDPNDLDNSIRLTFKDDKTGEMRDSAIDTVYIYNDETEDYDIGIYCPDTVVVTAFSCSYDKGEETMYLTLENDPRPFKMHIIEITSDAIEYENEYGTDYVERAYLKRISDKPAKSAIRNNKEVRHPHNRPGALFGNR